MAVHAFPPCFFTRASWLSVLLDLGKDEQSMILQYRDAERGYVVWRDYTVDGEQVLSPVDIDVLPPGRYRLV